MSSGESRVSSSIPTRRTFGTDERGNDRPSSEQTPVRQILARISFPNGLRRLGLIPPWRRAVNDEESAAPPSEPAPIPSALTSAGEASYATPLPLLSMIVLSITMLGEFLSANVSVPFVLFMVKGFGQYSDEAGAAFWTGVLVSTFFMTQFLTSLLWATVADKHGQRTVLFVSLLGSAVTCLVFGTSTSLHQAIVVRLLQGVFAGAVGVARGTVVFVTDPSNEGRAYAILGFCWGFGGVAGAIIGGAFESPAQKWPGVIEKYPLLVKYPYLLPCALAASITFIGSVLSLFLGRDGGPREGAIRLLPEKDNNIPPTISEEDIAPLSPAPLDLERRSVVASLRTQVSKYLAQRVPDARASTPVPMSPSGPKPIAIPERSRGFSRTSRANGSAYGYTGSYRSRLRSTARRGSLASRRRRGSNAGTSIPQEGSELNFAQRLLMANENAVTNIADLWVAAAINADNEDPFDSDTEGDDSEVLEEEDDVPGSAEPRLSRPGHRPSNVSFRSDFRTQRRPSGSASLSTVGRLQHASPLSGAPPPQTELRRFSTVSSLPVPSIFSHSGVRPPPAIIDAQQLLTVPDGGQPLTPIDEHRPNSDNFVAEKPPSLASKVPVLIIVQYGLLALHTTTHDQIFMSYLVSKYEAGGLNLNAGHFAQLIALMCLAQIAYQFYLYPNMGPPRGRFSHLAMFRMGSCFFIPSYLTVILYRAFASPKNDGNIILMAALALSTALRYCGITFGYTAISILLNYMTPPSAVGFANGIAQSIVSLARCVGPVLGGYLWSVSVQDNPSGYPLGFLICSAACAVAVVSSYVIR